MKWYVYYAHLFMQLLKRDIFVFKKERWKQFAINYILFCPAVYAFSFGYVIPYSGLETFSVAAASVFFAGSVSWLLYPLAFMLCLELFFDLQQNRFIDYQLTLAPARLVLAERLFFFSSITWLHLLPYYPISKWLLGNYFDTSSISWVKLFVILYFCSLFFVAFSLFFIFFIDRMHQIANFFIRIVFPMIQTGGLRTPLHILFQFTYWLGIFSLLNPVMYMTEGIRQAIFQSNDYLPYAISIAGLTVGTILSMLACCVYFKKRVGHI